MIKVPVETLKQLLDYNQETGKLFWKQRQRELFKTEGSFHTWNTRFSGKEAFIYRNELGYLAGCIFGVRFLAHRVCWALHYGKWPAEQIDHINGTTTDNRIINLRDVSNIENGKNQKRSRINKSGVTGICQMTGRNSWVVQIRINGKNLVIGYFKNRDDAIVVRNETYLKYGFHPNHGRAP